MNKFFTISAIALTLGFSISKAQTIPNAGFETWSSMGTYNNPVGWDNLNMMTSSASVYTCEKGTPGSPGTAYLKLTSKTISGMGVMPGVAVSGVIDQNTFQPKSGFPFTAQPQSLTGKWQHMIYGNSQGFIDVKLTRWDATMNMRVNVAAGHVNLSGMAMSWANFTIPLTYTDFNAPDTCIIVMSASGLNPTNLDYLWVDNLAFAGSVTGIKENNSSSNILVYPNPASSILNINLSALKGKSSTIKIFDAQGKLLQEVKNVINNIATSIDIDDFAKGYYILNVVSNSETITKQFIKE